MAQHEATSVRMGSLHILVLHFGNLLGCSGGDGRMINDTIGDLSMLLEMLYLDEGEGPVK